MSVIVATPRLCHQILLQERSTGERCHLEPSGGGLVMDPTMRRGLTVDMWCELFSYSFWMLINILISVPLDYFNSSAGVAEIALGRSRAMKQPKKGTVLFNFGIDLWWFLLSDLCLRAFIRWSWCSRQSTNGQNGPQSPILNRRWIRSGGLWPSRNWRNWVISLKYFSFLFLRDVFRPRTQCFEPPAYNVFRQNTILERSYDFGPNLTDPGTREHLIELEREAKAYYKAQIEVCQKTMGESPRYMGTSTISRDVDFITTVLEGKDALM